MLRPALALLVVAATAVVLPPASAQARPDPVGDLPPGVSPVARVTPAPLPTP
ncbi:MAG: hypothetical protein JWO22_1359, partial [Frankiales bacterium]|nr:hypothetical protein [Frankiales bacterium]